MGAVCWPAGCRCLAAARSSGKGVASGCVPSSTITGYAGDRVKLRTVTSTLQNERQDIAGALISP